MRIGRCLKAGVGSKDAVPGRRPPAQASRSTDFTIIRTRFV